jgi:hypothetical protein
MAATLRLIWVMFIRTLRFPISLRFVQMNFLTKVHCCLFESLIKNAIPAEEWIMYDAHVCTLYVRAWGMFVCLYMY